MVDVLGGIWDYEGFEGFGDFEDCVFSGYEKIWHHHFHRKSAIRIVLEEITFEEMTVGNDFSLLIVLCMSFEVKRVLTWTILLMDLYGFQENNHTLPGTLGVQRVDQIAQYLPTTSVDEVQLTKDAGGQLQMDLRHSVESQQLLRD